MTNALSDARPLRLSLASAGSGAGAASAETTLATPTGPLAKTARPMDGGDMAGSAASATGAELGAGARASVTIAAGSVREIDSMRDVASIRERTRSLREGATAARAAVDSTVEPRSEVAAVL